MLTQKIYKYALTVEITLIIFLLVCIIGVSIWSIKRQSIRSGKDHTSILQQNPDPQRSDKDVSTGFGIASYYDNAFHGQLTASGEPYDKNALTAAHRTYPFGFRVRVTNLENGRSVVVRINDRGPHTKERMIDLSARAAKAIGLVRLGVANVKVEVIQ